MYIYYSLMCPLYKVLSHFFVLLFLLDTPGMFVFIDRAPFFFFSSCILNINVLCTRYLPLMV